MNSFSGFDLNEEGHFEGLLSQSKQIKKTAKNYQQKQYIFDEEINTQQSSNGRKGAKYDTFDSQEREDIYDILKTQGDLNDILSYKAPKYRQLLKDIIPQFRSEFKNADNNQMTQMWKKIKGIITSKSANKSEKRGEPIILDDELPEFRAAVKAIIKTLKTKDFEAFRKKLLPIIKAIRTKGGRPFDANVFKKHKWSEFVNEEANADIRRQWKALKRTNKKDTYEKEEETVSSCYESNETMASEADYSEDTTSSSASPLGYVAMESVEEEGEVNFDDFDCRIEVPDVVSYESSIQNYGVDCFFAFGDSNTESVEENIKEEYWMEVPQTPSFGLEVNNNFGANEKFIKEGEEDTYQLEFFAGLGNGKFFDNLFEF